MAFNRMSAALSVLISRNFSKILLRARQTLKFSHSLGHYRTNHHGLKSTLVRFGPKADKRGRNWILRFVPKADSCTAANSFAIRSPRQRARARSAEWRGRVPPLLQVNGSIMPGRVEL